MRECTWPLKQRRGGQETWVLRPSRNTRRTARRTLARTCMSRSRSSSFWKVDSRGSTPSPRRQSGFVVRPDEFVHAFWQTERQLTIRLGDCAITVLIHGELGEALDRG